MIEQGSTEKPQGGAFASGNQALPQDCEESIPKTHAQETVLWQNLFE